MFNSEIVTATVMPRGLKSSSDIIIFGANVTESAANTYTELEINLNLDPLNQEVFVVQAIDLDVTPPDAIAATNTDTRAQLSTVTQTAFVGLANANVIGTKSMHIRAAGFADGGVLSDQYSGDTPSAALDYVGIIATDNCFLSVAGRNNGTAKSAQVKVYGYRAKADAAIYAALVQSELLS
jgi:hypothetical protein